MTQVVTPVKQPGLTSLDLGDTRDLRIIRDSESNTVWAHGKMRKLFFVTGHARSGTTWAAAVLSRHPQVFCDGEFHFNHLREGFRLFQSKPWHRARRDPVHTTAEACFQDTIRLCIGACAHQKMDAEWIGDRTPRLLEVFLPGAPHFAIVRDGRDVVVSVSILQINNGGGLYPRFANRPKLKKVREKFLADAEFFKNNPHELLCCEAYVRQIARNWATQATHDREMADRIEAGEFGDTTVRIVRYENLHADPEGERDAMYRMLGVEPGEAEELTAESGTKPGLQTDNHRSDKRKGVVGDWVNYFTDDAKRWFKEEAGEAMIAMGYEQDLNW